MQGQPSEGSPEHWEPWSGLTAWQPKMHTSRMHSPCSRGKESPGSTKVRCLAWWRTYALRLPACAARVMWLAYSACTSRLLANGASGATTPAAEPEPSAAALRETMAKLEEQFASRSLFRRFVSTHTARGSQAAEACSSPSFLSATAGIIKCAPEHACPRCAPLRRFSVPALTNFPIS